MTDYTSLLGTYLSQRLINTGQEEVLCGKRKGTTLSYFYLDQHRREYFDEPQWKGLDFCWGGRGRLSFLESRQSSEQSQFTITSCLVFRAQVNSVFLSRTTNWKVETLGSIGFVVFLNLCYHPSTRLLLITMNTVIWY